MTQGAQTLRIHPGETKEFVVKFTAPQGLDASQFPVYSGHVVIQSAIERLSVSYLGVAANMKDMQIFDHTTKCECCDRRSSAPRD